MPAHSKMNAGSVHRDAEFKELDANGFELVDIEFDDCRLREADFSEADLRASAFSACDLRGSFSYKISAFSSEIKKARFSPPKAVSLLHGLDIIMEDSC